jgi:hypothetical protein
MSTVRSLSAILLNREKSALVLFKDPLPPGRRPTTAILIRARSVVQVHPGPPSSSGYLCLRPLIQFMERTMGIEQIRMNQTKALPPVPQFNWSQMESNERQITNGRIRERPGCPRFLRFLMIKLSRRFLAASRWLNDSQNPECSLSCRWNRSS